MKKSKGKLNEASNLLSISKETIEKLHQDIDGIIISSGDITSYFDFLATILVKSKKIKEAIKLLNEAKRRVVKGRKYFCILRSLSDVYLSVNNIRRALDVFSCIKPVSRDILSSFYMMPLIIY